MYRRTRQILAVALVIVLMVAVVAYAQNRPGRVRPPKPDSGFDVQHVPWLEPGDRQERFYRFVNLQRFLLPPSGRELQRLAVMLGLTEDQKARIKELFQQFIGVVKPPLDQRGAAVKEVLQGIQSPTPDKNALKSAASRVMASDEAILDAEFDFWIGFRSVLNTQQQGQVSQFLQQRTMKELSAGPKPGGTPMQPAK